MDIPLFGEARETPTIERPAAYALVSGPNGVLTVGAREGALFLPGGGLDAAETPEQTVVRELREECCLDVACVGIFGEAIQLFTARDGRSYRSHMVFIECRCVGAVEGEPEHDVLWQSGIPETAQFAHEAHRWAFAEYLAHRNGQTAQETE